MTEEEQKAIEKMYEEGLVNVSKIAEPLINKYKELDYQQCQFVIEYLLADRQFNEEYVDKLEADIEIKDKVIEKTCRYINEAKIMNKAIPVYPNKVDTPYTVGVASIEEIKQYFYKKVEEENNVD